jgi:hypothetical protein
MRSNKAVRIIITLAIGTALTILCLATAARQTRATAVAATISDFAWISGDWQTQPGARAQIEEHWMRPAGGSMLGMSRTVAGDKTVEFEYLSIEQRGEEIYYVAHPQARCPGTDFKLTSLSAQEAVFENPQHDFPKRIIYRKNPDGSLLASIDAGAGTKTMTFTYRSVSK